uniref:hypothetical protein n=1 Tax=Fulvivirga sp. TaxID=1931237 RepID=UPI0040498195
MGGGGFMHDANRILRQNKSLIDRAKQRFGKGIGEGSGHKSTTNLDSYKHSNPEQLKRIREDVKVQRKAENRRRIKLLVISLIGGIIAAKILLMWMEA